MELVYHFFRHYIAALVALKNVGCFLKLVIRFFSHTYLFIIKYAQ